MASIKMTKVIMFREKISIDKMTENKMFVVKNIVYKMTVGN
jgi:hypothetical protein